MCRNFFFKSAFGVLCHQAVSLRFFWYVPQCPSSPPSGSVPGFPPLRYGIVSTAQKKTAFVVATFLFRPFLFAPLRFAFFKVEKRNRPLFFQRWLFLHSLRGSGTPTADFYIFPLLRHWVARRGTPKWLRSGGYSPAPCSRFRSRPQGSLRLPPHHHEKKFWAKMPKISFVPWEETPTARSPTKKSAISASLHCHFFGGAFFSNFEE